MSHGYMHTLYANGVCALQCIELTHHISHIGMLLAVVDEALSVAATVTVTVTMTMIVTVVEKHGDSDSDSNGDKENG